MLKKAYLEITNVCNLSCSFCHGTSRKSHFLTEEEFIHLAKKLRGHISDLYFHLMGEPLLHPKLKEFLQIGGELGFRVILTTNGTCLPKAGERLLNSPALHKVSISLHSYEVNSTGSSLKDYLDNCFSFARAASGKGILCVLRLWNQGGEDRMNQQILDQMHDAFPEEWTPARSGSRLIDRVFLEWGERFDWPDLEGEEFSGSYGCYGLRDQIGILCDGTVVPCCLDAEGAIPLGNLFWQELDEILASERAKKLKWELQNRKPREALCRRCGYAHQKNY